MIRDLLLQVAFLLQDLGGLDGDAVAQDACYKDADVKRGHSDLDPMRHLKLWDMSVVNAMKTV